ncbi:hypothetical protein LMG28688_02821 [Paraburkholderia caffeinitolerans]|uniref:Uncharacterized protein n=1 Tax=Paraburkholderia caffeinitolerans TaxID=1723730 RepID=A0A6J5G1I7_9BURK|nr:MULTISPECIES: hypothetical protein [Paraburkholderia]CAB3789086.1 hypothetical protein LMG28688_02821 [Paraburkholderia caffeinitolerans]
MYKRLIFLAVLALPGSFFIITAVSFHPRGRALLADVVGFAVPHARYASTRDGTAR